jgi:hypothetical protein
MSEPRKVKVLTRLKITEVSAVDRGAGEGCRVILSKRDDDDNTPLTDAERDRAKFEGRMALRDQEDIERREKRDRDDERLAFLKAIFKGEIDVVEHYAKAAAGDSEDERDAAQVVDAVAAKESVSFDLADGTRMRFPNEAALATWLAVQQRIHKSTSTPEDTTMNPTEKLKDLAKRVGPIAIAKVMVEEDRAYGITEHELTDMIVAYAKQSNPELSDAMAFAKVFTDSSEGAVLLRRAVQIAKNSVFESAVDDSDAACAELAKIGKERWPSLTKAQQFARAAETNPKLLAKAHRRPSVFSAFPFPVAKAPLTNVDGVTLKPVATTETSIDSPEAALAELKRLGAQKYPSASASQQFINAVTDFENGDLVRVALGPPKGSSPARQ